MKVLIVTPVWQLYSATVARILTQDWQYQFDTVFLSGDDAAQPSHVRIKDKYERARGLCLAGDYDAMLTVEADMLLPAYALSALATVQADIAYGMYCWRHPELAHALNIYRSTSDEAADPLYMHPDLARANWGGVMDCAGVGLGCTLIRRNVLEAQPFRHVASKRGLHCDWWYAVDAQVNGFSQAAHLGVACGHIIDRSLAVWPEASTDQLHVITRYEGA